MYTASLLFTLALVATTLALPVANPVPYVATVTENEVVVVTVTAGAPGANNANNEKLAATPTPAPVVPTTAPTTPPTTALSSAASSAPSNAPAVFAQVNKPSSVNSPVTTSSSSHSAAATSAAASATVVQGGSGATTNGPELTVTLINQYGKAISTRHGDNNPKIAATAVNEKTLAPGTMKNSATAVFAVPTGWGGNVFIADADHDITDNDSLLEGSYGVQGSAGIQTDIDVSYVNGFSVPIICKCHDTTKKNLFQKVTGCNIDLFSQGGCTDKTSTGTCGKCAKLDGNGACINPKRSSGAEDANVIPDSFFSPCSGEAYLFPFDGDGGNNGNSKCAGSVTCCVGTSCS